MTYKQKVYPKDCTKCGIRFESNRAPMCPRCSHCVHINNWNKKNRDKVRVWQRRRLSTNILARIDARLRDRLYDARKRIPTRSLAIDHLGCSLAEFKVWLESQFQPGMTWKNWGYGKGKWNMDHIRAFMFFDLHNEDHIRQVCHYSNIRPMWHDHNMRRRHVDPLTKKQRTKRWPACREEMRNA